MQVIWIEKRTNPVFRNLVCTNIYRVNFQWKRQQMKIFTKSNQKSTFRNINVIDGINLLKMSVIVIFLWKLWQSMCKFSSTIDICCHFHRQMLTRLLNRLNKFLSRSTIKLVLGRSLQSLDIIARCVIDNRQSILLKHYR